MRNDLISNWQDNCGTSARMRVFDACCRSDNVRSWKERVQLGGLFMSPVRFLDGNWSFLYAGLMALSLSSPGLPGCVHPPTFQDVTCRRLVGCSLLWSHR